MQRARGNRIYRVQHVLLDVGLSRMVFEHARNLVVATLVLAVGIEATEHDPREIGVLFFKWTGYFVAAFGAGLVLLNLAEGLCRLSKARLPRAWHALLIVFYVLLFWRIVHLIVLFR